MSPLAAYIDPSVTYVPTEMEVGTVWPVEVSRESVGADLFDILADPTLTIFARQLTDADTIEILLMDRGEAAAMAALVKAEADAGR